MSSHADLRVAVSQLLASGPLALPASIIGQLRELAVDGVGDPATLQATVGGSRRAAVGDSTRLSVVPLTGLLVPGENLLTLFGLGTSLRAFMAALRAAAQEPSAGILLAIDSPGGECGLVPEAAAVVRDVARQKPVLGAVAGKCCSAAYWIASGATRLDATPSAGLGSIGVFTVHTSLAGALAKDGIALTLISAGKYKTEGNPTEPLSAAGRAHQQAVVDETYGQFVRDVAIGRRVSEAAVRTGYGEGRIVTAAMALRMGMIDRIATLDETIAGAGAATPTVALTAGPTQARFAASVRTVLAPYRRQLARAAQTTMKTR